MLCRGVLELVCDVWVCVGCVVLSEECCRVTVHER